MNPNLAAVEVDRWIPLPFGVQVSSLSAEHSNVGQYFSCLDFICDCWTAGQLKRQWFYGSLPPKQSLKKKKKKKL